MSNQQSHALEYTFRVFVALQRDDVFNVQLKNWPKELPKLTRRWYETIPWERLAAVYPEEAFSDDQLGEGWKLPDWSSFNRYVRVHGPDGAPINKVEDFLFIAGAMIKEIERNGSSDDRAIYAKRAIYRLRPDIDAIRDKVKGIRKRLERLENENLLPDRAVKERDSRSISRQFSSSCGQLAHRLVSDARYVPLTLITEGRPAEGVRGGISDRYDDLTQAAQSIALPLLVLLGGPGSGKPTLMRRLYGELLRETSERDEASVPLLVTLGAGPAVNPIDAEALAAETWELAYGRDLPPFREVARLGRAFLLLDGFNEGGNACAADGWKAFLQERFLAVHGNRAIVACRKADHTLPLSADGSHVPHIRIAPLDPGGIEKYLGLADPRVGKALLHAILDDPTLTALYGSPFFLSVLVDDANAINAVRAGRTSLLARLIWRLLHREYCRAPAGFADPLFTQGDRARIANSPDFRATTRLPDQGVFIRCLSEFAFVMGNRTSIGVEEAEQVIAKPGLIDAKSCVKAARDMGILSLDFEQWAVFFAHQLLQEFFAANKVAESGGSEGMWRLRWRKNELPCIETPAPDEPLPDLPTTGWEEATVMASVLSRDPERFVSHVFAVNPLLAARCVNAPETAVSRELHGQVQSGLLEIMHAEEADFRARLAAALLMTDIEHLGYQRRGSPAPHLVPPSVPIEAGTYRVGTSIDNRSGLKWHAHRPVLPEGLTPLDAYDMCVYHVTNAEFALFIAAGGYDEAEWWPEGGARRWLERDGFFGDLLWQLEADIETDRIWGAHYIESQIGLRWTSEEGNLKMARLAWSQMQKEEWLRKEVDRFGSPKHPGFWFNPDFNAPTQPVVSVSWYEASAYCRWLSDMTGDGYRLPTEQEYEAVARGLVGQAVPYGSEPDPAKCNIRPSKIGRPTPIGLYPDGQFRGVNDMVGNVWTWTNSFDLPDDANELGRRVTRGGSYDTAQEFVRAYFRDSNHPGNRNRYDGFRMVRGSRPP